MFGTLLRRMSSRIAAQKDYTYNKETGGPSGIQMWDSEVPGVSNSFLLKYQTLFP
jgi:hypothetical protein